MCLGFLLRELKSVMRKALSYNPQYKGIRLDVFAKDGSNTHYDIEMQVISGV